MKYKRFLKATKTPEVLAVIENLPVTANGYFLDDAQLANVEASLTLAESDAAALLVSNEKVTDLEAQITALTGERDAANASLTTANESVTNLTTERDTLKAEVKKLGGKTEAPEETNRTEDPTLGSRKKKGLNSMDAYAKSLGL